VIVSGYLLVPDSTKILLDGGVRPVYFALKAQMEAFYHIARAGIVRVYQYHFIVRVSRLLRVAKMITRDPFSVLPS